MSFLKSNFSIMGIIYSGMMNVGIAYPHSSYVGNILIYLPIFKQHGHFMPTFKFY